MFVLDRSVLASVQIDGKSWLGYLVPEPVVALVERVYQLLVVEEPVVFAARFERGEVDFGASLAGKRGGRGQSELALFPTSFAVSNLVPVRHILVRVETVH